MLLCHKFILREGFVGDRLMRPLVFYFLKPR